MTKFNEVTNKSQSNQMIAKARQMTWLFVAFVFALIIYPSRAHAQVIGTLEVNIPFEFQAGNAVLPPGNYTIHMVDNTELAIMQITSKDNSSSAIFRVREKDLTSAPTQDEVVFNKYGDHYFLAQVFDGGDPSGSEVVESKYEQKVSKEAVAATKVNVATQQRQQQGD
jgi:hypothetical protein